MVARASCPCSDDEDMGGAPMPRYGVSKEIIRDSGCFQVRGNSVPLGRASAVRSLRTFFRGVEKRRVMGSVWVFKPTEFPPPVAEPWISGLRPRQTMVRLAPPIVLV